jgi:MoaA/NifB/PqqE/SkfB family radical SAM enzyme
MGDVSIFRLIDSYRAYNFLQVGERFCAIPQAAGPVSPNDLAILQGRFALWADRAEALPELVDCHGAWDKFSILAGPSDPLYSPTPLDEEGLPEVVEIEPIHTCNLRCIMCHVSFEKVSKRRIDVSFIDRLGGLEGKWARVGANYEPVAHPQFAEIVQGLTRQGLKIDLTTNGTLFTPRLIARIKDCNFRIVTISFDGARRETYERIRRRGDFELTIQRIAAFKQAVQARNPDVYFALNYTVLKSNIDEIVEAVDLWERHGFDHIGFISMILRSSEPSIVAESPEPVAAQVGEHIKTAVERIVTGGYRITLSSPWLHDAEIRAAFPDNVGVFGAGLAGSNRADKRWPFTPGTHFQNGAFPGMHVDCRSPFKFIHIAYDGNVQLCQKISVGSIYRDDLLTIWNVMLPMPCEPRCARAQDFATFANISNSASIRTV